MARLKTLSLSFNQYEADEGNFELRDRDGFPWWDLVRYSVQNALCVERGIYGLRTGLPPTKITRAKSFVRQTRWLLRDIARLNNLGSGQVNILAISNRKLDYLEELFKAEAARSGAVLIANKSGFVPDPHIAIAKQSIDFFIRLARQGQSLPPDIKRESRHLAGDIAARFDSKSNIFELITCKYRQHLAARHAWSFILDRAEAPERIIYVNDDTMKTMVHLARARGVLTEELQHGYMGRSHIGFSYPSVGNDLSTLPDRVLVTRDTGDIIYPSELVLVSKTRPQTPNNKRRDIDVLVGASPTLAEDTIGILEALVGQDLNLAVKLHPIQTEEGSKLRERFTEEEVTIYAGAEDFCELASRAHLYVPANPTSTTTFEAVEMGARLVVVDFNGVKKTAINDGFASARADSLQKLSGIVLSQIAIKTKATSASEGLE